MRFLESFLLTALRTDQHKKVAEMLFLMNVESLNHLFYVKRCENSW